MNRATWLSRHLAIGGLAESSVGPGLFAVAAMLAFILVRAPLEGAGIACWDPPGSGARRF